MDLLISCMFGTCSSPSTLCPQVCDKVCEWSSFLLSVSNSFLQSVSNPQGCTWVSPLGTPRPCSCVPDTHLFPQGWRDSAVPSPVPRDTAATLGYMWHGHSSGARAGPLTEGWPTGAKGCGDMLGCSRSPVPGCWQEIQHPLQGPAQGQTQPWDCPSSGSTHQRVHLPNCQEQKIQLPSAWPLLHLQWKIQLRFPAPATAQNRDK